MESSKKLYILCNISLLMAAMISGLSFVAQKAGMNYVGPFTFNVLRSLIGSLSLLPVIFLQAKISKIQMTKEQSKALWKGGFLAGLVLFIAFSINQYCMIFAPAGKAGFITSLYVLFVPVIAVFMKQKLLPNVQISIVLAFIGLYLLCAKGAMEFEIHDILLLVSAFFFALHIIVVSYYSKRTSAFKLSGLQFLVAGTLALPIMLFYEHPVLAAIAAGWKPILFAGIVVTAVAYTLQILGHKATHPVLATLILSSEAVFAVFGGMIFLGETLSLREVSGCVFMIAAIILSQLPFNSKRQSDDLSI